MPVSVAPVPTERSTFRSSNAEETTEFIREKYVENRTSFSQVKPENRFQATLAGVGSMRADHVTGNLTLHLTGDPLGYALFGRVHRGTWHLGPHRREVMFGPGESLLYPLGEPFTLHARNFDIAVVSVPLNQLAALAASHSGIDAADLKFHSMTAVSTAMSRHFDATLALVHDEVHRTPRTASAPLLADHLSRLMMAAVLTTFPNTTMTAAPSSEPGYAGLSVLRRARDFIENNADQPVTLADIATAAGTSGRELQRAFRRHHSTTPMAYLRRVRLERAHRDLQAADWTRGVTVDDIAVRWGFHTSENFVAAYETEYGVAPSHTLMHAT